MNMTHVDLFTGICGFTLAAQWAGFDTAAMCEINPYCRQLIKLRYPRIKVYGNIKKLSWTRFIADTQHTGSHEPEKRKGSGKGKNGKQAGKKTGCELKGQDCFAPDPELHRCDKPEISAEQRPHNKNLAGGITLLTGGFPCQPFSVAGERRGADDDRFLWPEMFRVVKEFRPAWVIAENVGGLTSMVQWTNILEMAGEADFFEEVGKIYERTGDGILNRICNDLETAGYDVQPIIIPACAVGASHRRDRIWIIGHAECRGLPGDAWGRSGEKPANGYSDAFANRAGSGLPHSHAANPDKFNTYDSGHGAGEILRQRGKTPEIRGCKITDHSQCTGLEGHSEYGENPQRRSIKSRSVFPSSWGLNWIDVASRLCRVDDGLPVSLDGFKLSKSRHRMERLKGLGNAILPELAYRIIGAIAAIERGEV
ncbi:MAG: DNA cytosine methyltransferase [Victivallales bacterium]